MISSPGCLCRGAAAPGANSTRTWIASRPGVLEMAALEISGARSAGRWADGAAAAASKMATIRTISYFAEATDVAAASITRAISCGCEMKATWLAFDSRWCGRPSAWRRSARG